MRNKTVRRRYVYSFGVWPDEDSQPPSAVCELFRMLGSRIEMSFTKPEFEEFRSAILEYGITLREIQRVPYFKPETVF
jgi:hypothetical protein